VDGVVVGLRPVAVTSTDYALQEYGLGEKEMAAAEKRITGEITKARKRGQVRAFTGSLDELRD
jgi:hypothetical protein